jgi:hypothetical protein
VPLQASIGSGWRSTPLTDPTCPVVSQSSSLSARFASGSRLLLAPSGPLLMHGFRRRSPREDRFKLVVSIRFISQGGRVPDAVRAEDQGNDTGACIRCAGEFRLYSRRHQSSMRSTKGSLGGSPDR